MSMTYIICKCGHTLADHMPEPSAGCIVCARLDLPEEKECQCYEEDKNFKGKILK